MALAYLTAENALSKLIAMGVNNSGLTIASLTEVLEAIETRIDEWNHYRVAPTTYEERLRTNDSGNLLLTNYPVISLSSVYLYNDFNAGFNNPNPLEIKIDSIWRQDRRLYVGSPLSACKVTYTAGYDPIPPIFGQVVLAVLQQVIKKSGSGADGLSVDLSFLDEPTRDMTQLSLPGGLSKTYRIAGGGSSGSGGNGSDTAVSQLDRLLAPLKRYRRKFIS